jgi:copper(I)-binding protein
LYKISPVLLVAALLPALASAEPKADLQLEGAWVRALPATQKNTAAYLEVTNNGGEAVSITGGRAELAQQVEIHTTREVDGYMRMEQLDQLSLAPGAVVKLAPGGTHLMLLGLERMPAEGEAVGLCLTLAGGAEFCTEAEVRKTADTQHHHHHEQD